MQFGDGPFPSQCVDCGIGRVGAQQVPEPEPAAHLDVLRYSLPGTWRTFRPNRLMFHEVYFLPAEAAAARGCAGLKPGFDQ